MDKLKDGPYRYIKFVPQQDGTVLLFGTKGGKSQEDTQKGPWHVINLEDEDTRDVGSTKFFTHQVTDLEEY